MIGLINIMTNTKTESMNKEDVLNKDAYEYAKHHYPNKNYGDEYIQELAKACYEAGALKYYDGTIYVFRSLNKLIYRIWKTTYLFNDGDVKPFHEFWSEFKNRNNILLPDEYIKDPEQDEEDY